MLSIDSTLVAEESADLNCCLLCTADHLHKPFSIYESPNF